jgi:hypothetical protein
MSEHRDWMSGYYAGAKAERFRVLGLLDNEQTLQNIYQAVYWGLSPHPRGMLGPVEIEKVLKAELMGEDDE